MVGAILLLLVLSTAYVAAQVQVAPVVQSDTEHQHARKLLADMQSVQSELIKVAATGQRQAHTVTMGSRYPFRILLLHPPDPSSSFFNHRTLEIRMDNARAVDAETADFVDGSTHTYESTALNLRPQYFEFRNAPTYRLEHGTLYADYPGHEELVTHGGLINGRQINLIAVEADVDVATTRPLNVQLVPLSASSETTQIEDGGPPITFRIETSQSEEMWRSVLGGEISEGPNDGRYVRSIDLDTSTTPNTLVVRMVGGEQYQLNLAKVGVRRGGETGIPSSEVPDATYVTSVSNTAPIIGEEQSMLLTVQVRDGFHNPAPSVQVEASAGSGTVAGQPVQLSDSGGYVTFRYEAPEVSGSIADVPDASDAVTVSVVGETGSRWTIEYDVEVQNTHASGGS